MLPVVSLTCMLCCYDMQTGPSLTERLEKMQEGMPPPDAKQEEAEEKPAETVSRAEDLRNKLVNQVLEKL